MTRSTIALVLALGASGCASAPPVVPPAPPPPTYEEKSAWILRLEDERRLRDPVVPQAPQVPVPPARGRSIPVVVAPTPPPPPDLVRLLADSEGRVRRRAALAVGRVGLAEGVQPLVALLRDPDNEVRQMAAFSLGLIGDKSARDALVLALDDPSPLVKGSAAEALGLLGDASAADAVSRMASAVLASGALASVPSDALDASRDTPAAAYRLALYALVRLKSYDALAAAALDPSGQPRVRWWPVSFALQRLEDPRALPALLTLLSDPHPYTRAFAAKGLGAMKNRAAVDALIPLITAPELAIAGEAIRALGRLRDPAAAPALLKLLQAPKSDPQLRLDAANVIGGLGGGASVGDALIDLLGDPNPLFRAAALRGLAQLDAEGFVTVLSGLDVDADWRVRTALASVLGTLTPEAGMPRLLAMLGDADQRVVPAVISAIAMLKPDAAGAIMIERLQSSNPVIRAAAARAIADLTPPTAVVPLTEAYRRGAGDTTYVARAAALTAIAAYGLAQAAPTLTTALGDPEWAVRVRAATLLEQLDPNSDASRRIRPALSGDAARFASPSLVAPAFSSEALIVTDRGTIRIELAVLDAPQTVQNFVTLARQGFFDGVAVHRVVPNFVIQAGDPGGDGEGGPGYTIRDELNQRPYVRGTVGMALDWEDTGGSQFFITHSPQPHLDARYTVFGRVLSGMEVVDRIEQGDVIRRVVIWDGLTPIER